MKLVILGLLLFWLLGCSTGPAVFPGPASSAVTWRLNPDRWEAPDKIVLPGRD